MFLCVLKICKKHRIVNFGSKNAFLCKFLDAKEVCPTFRDRPLKRVLLLGRNYVIALHFAANFFFDYSDSFFCFAKYILVRRRLFILHHQTRLLPVQAH